MKKNIIMMIIAIVLLIIPVTIILVNKSNSKVEEDNNSTVKINKEEITKEEGKVNIYLFHGDGCPHCAELRSYLKSIKSKYSEYYHLYEFEVWNDFENSEFMQELADKMGDDASGVPYMIIGEKSFGGFDPNTDKQAIIDAIMVQHESYKDIYLDK